jgi:hypothetical protein
MIHGLRPAAVLPGVLMAAALLLLIATNVAGIRALQSSSLAPATPNRTVTDVAVRRSDGSAVHPRSAVDRRTVPSQSRAGSNPPPVIARTTTTTSSAVPIRTTRTVAAPRSQSGPATTPPVQTTPRTQAAPTRPKAPAPAQPKPKPKPAPRTTPAPKPAPTFDERGTTPASEAPAVQFDDSGSGSSPPPG